jgi:Vps5 C terminal like
MGNKLVNVATTETHPPIANAMRKLGRTWHTLADLDQAQAISECVILSDTLGYQGLNARSAKETLQQRTAVLEEYQAAVKSAISKRRHIERLKASANIRPERVDEALEDLEEVILLFSSYLDVNQLNANLFRRTNMNKYSSDALTVSPRTCIVRYRRTGAWPQMISPLLLSSTHARPSCTSGSSSGNWNLFGQTLQILTRRSHPSPTESQNQWSYHR